MWYKRSNAHSVEEVLKERGFDTSLLLNDTRSYSVSNLKEAAECLLNHLDQHITVVADYDCDGVMSGAICDLILKSLHADYSIRFPKRMSEGYGFSPKIAAEIPNNSFLITIDNGIAAAEAIDSVRRRGVDCIVLDHHLERDDKILPPANVVVDPHVLHQDGEFLDYCGAGLGYRISKELELPDDIQQRCLVLAAIATIQDVVPLQGDNRNIIRQGLSLLNHGIEGLDGIYALIHQMKIQEITEEEIAFKIGPCINAMGRMYDDGAAKACTALMRYRKGHDEEIAAMVDCNEMRKKETKKQYNQLLPGAEQYKNDKIMVVYGEDLKEGLIGLNAASFVEEYHKPCIVFTNSDNGMLKGSARSIDGVNIKEELDKASSLLAGYGGHAKAAGLSVSKENLSQLRHTLNANLNFLPVPDSNIYYDLEIQEGDEENTYEDIRRFYPYGEDFPPISIKISNYTLHANYGRLYRMIGDSGISLNGKYSECCSFSGNLRQKYLDCGKPEQLDVVGELGYSSFSRKPQLMLYDFETSSEFASGCLI